MLDRLRFPIIQAPMAGGISTPAMAIAVSRAGGLGFLASGMLTPQVVRDQLAEVRAGLDGEPFGVNVFMPSQGPANADAMAAYAELIAPLAASYGVELGEPVFGTDHHEEKLALLLEQPPPVVSFVFGCPAPELIDRFHAAGAAVWVTATQVDEARTAVAAGADAVVLQGSEAGGHRGAFVDDDRPQVPLLTLLAAVRDEHLGVPLVGAGALMTAAHITEAFAHGAVAAQLGSAFMLTLESGASPTVRAALAAPGTTTITRAFTGRRARGLSNRWTDLARDHAPSAYPDLMQVTAPLRAEGVRLGDRNAFNVWAGERHDEARRISAAQVVESLAGAL